MSLPQPVVGAEAIARLRAAEPAPRRPRMLFLCQTLPFPPDGGVNIRTYHILRLLSQSFDVTALCFYRAKDRPTQADVEESIANLREFGHVEAFAIPQEHSRLRFVADHILSVALGIAYTVNVYASRAFRSRLCALLNERRFEIVHMDSLDLAGYLPLLRGQPVVCVHHNVESELLRRRSDAEPAFLSRLYLRFQARLLEQQERRWCEQVSLNIAVSDIDARKLARLAPAARLRVVPNGVDTESFRPGLGLDDGVVFVGGANWFPNRDALTYFCDEILPLIRNSLPDVHVRWVGRASPELQAAFLRDHSVDLTGYVSDIRPFVRDAACFVVPLRVGGGTRLKILDAWALGKAVVSTSVGCEGLAAQDGENILIRNTPKDFADAVALVLRDRALRERLQRRARRTAEELYAWDAIGRNMVEEYRAVIGARSAIAKVSAPRAARTIPELGEQ